MEDRVKLWINTVLNEASKFDNNRGVQMMQICGAACSKTSALLEGAKKVNDQFPEETDPDILFESFKNQYYNTSRLSKTSRKVELIFEECTCPLVKEGVRNPFLCHCTTGYTKNIFETLFGKTVEVELKQSILQGDKICKQMIRISE